ncbi:MAG: sarcosine oxidase subunit gamma family protein [Granulosicoccaceae bacterium]
MINSSNQDSYSTQPLSIDTISVGALSLQQLPTSGKLILRGKPNDNAFTNRVSQLLECELPIKVNTVVTSKIGTVMWRGPDEWMIELSLDQVDSLQTDLIAILENQHINIVVVTDAYSVLRLSGQGAPDVLSSGCSLNLNKSEFGTDQCAQTHYHKIGIALRFVDETPTFDIFVRRSETEYLWRHLELACQTNAPH